MGRYFIEVAYKGTHYSGFQVQENANTIQSEVEKAFSTIHRTAINLTGSSRTDAGVHALQNYFHFDFERQVHPQALYKINAILPLDIVVLNISQMPAQSHARFDAISRKYEYNIHTFKSPFLTECSLFYPYKLNLDVMQEGAAFLKGKNNFFPFCKTNTQVKDFTCTIVSSEWQHNNANYIYTIEANRFLRGMVRQITATLLKLGRNVYSISEFKNLFNNNQKCGFSLPPHGLYLTNVTYSENYFTAPALHLNK